MMTSADICWSDFFSLSVYKQTWFSETIGSKLFHRTEIRTEFLSLLIIAKGVYHPRTHAAEKKKQAKKMHVTAIAQHFQLQNWQLISKIWSIGPTPEFHDHTQSVSGQNLSENIILKQANNSSFKFPANCDRTCGYSCKLWC